MCERHFLYVHVLQIYVKQVNTKLQKLKTPAQCCEMFEVQRKKTQNLL